MNSEAWFDALLDDLVKFRATTGLMVLVGTYEDKSVMMAISPSYAYVWDRPRDDVGTDVSVAWVEEQHIMAALNAAVVFTTYEDASDGLVVLHALLLGASGQETAEA